MQLAQQQLEPNFHADAAFAAWTASSSMAR
jgi:hypothetical protein